MSSPVQDLYETRVYPAMSHPLSDPAVSSVAALLAGLDVKHPSKARILEIGCCSGLNLIPLAMRWPESRFVGIDLSGPSIREARGLAAIAGVENIEFHAADLRDFDPGPEGFDFIIAHGFLSWVPDEVKASLFTFCQQHLAPSGIATISFNLEAGWMPRFPVIEKVRAIQQAGATDEMAALALLRSVTEPDSPELPIIDDMMAKGSSILAFDDLGPVNDPWSLNRLVRTAAAAGLRWLGESDPARNVPAGLNDLTLERLQRENPDLLSFQMAADQVTKQTFRSVVLCRTETAISQKVSLERLFELSVRVRPDSSDLSQNRLIQSIDSFFPKAIVVKELMEFFHESDQRDMARELYAGIQSGWILPRIEPVMLEGEPPDRPCLNAFRLECARRGMPLVDIWHQPCSFPARHLPVLVAMDGTRTRQELAEFSKSLCPELAFEPWLRHLAGRGMFT